MGRLIVPQFTHFVLEITSVTIQGIKWVNEITSIHKLWMKLCVKIKREKFFEKSSWITNSTSTATF
jgi:hypothetical protein